MEKAAFQALSAKIKSKGNYNGKAWEDGAGNYFRRSSCTDKMIYAGREYLLDKNTGLVSSYPMCWNYDAYKSWGFI